MPRGNKIKVTLNGGRSCNGDSSSHRMKRDVLFFFAALALCLYSCCHGIHLTGIHEAEAFDEGRIAPEKAPFLDVNEIVTAVADYMWNPTNTSRMPQAYGSIPFVLLDPSLQKLPFLNKSKPSNDSFLQHSNNKFVYTDIDVLYSPPGPCRLWRNALGAQNVFFARDLIHGFDINFVEF